MNSTIEESVLDYIQSCQGGGMVDAPPISPAEAVIVGCLTTGDTLVAAQGSRVVSVGRAGSSPAPDSMGNGRPLKAPAHDSDPVEASCVPTSCRILIDAVCECPLCELTRLTEEYGGYETERSVSDRFDYGGAL